MLDNTQGYNKVNKGNVHWHSIHVISALKQLLFTGQCDINNSMLHNKDINR